MSSPALPFRLARRELRGSLRRFGVFLTCLALGVAAVVAVGEVTAIVDHSLTADAKAISGGDLSVSRSHMPLNDHDLEYLRKLGDTSRSIQMRTMAFADARHADTSESTPPRSALVELKAVDHAYPLYGAVELQSPGAFHELLQHRDNTWGAVADPRILIKLGLQLGDVFRLGHARFRVTGILGREPDKAAQFFGLGPRLFIDLHALDDTGLVAPGTVLFHTEKIRLPPLGDAASDLARAKLLRETLTERLGPSGARVRDYTESGRSLRQFMDNLSTYLILVGLIALLVGGVGVANGVRGYLETKAGAIATMKCLGATKRTIFVCYLLQVLFLAGLGSFLGIVLGLVATWVAAVFLFSSLNLAQHVNVAFVQGLSLAPMAGGLCFGLLTALLFSIRPLAGACNVSPARLFRGYADPLPFDVGKAALAAMGLVLVVMFFAAWALAGNLKVVAGFSAGSLGGALAFRLAALGIMRLAKRAPKPRRIWLRQAIANLYRPGARTPDVVFSLGLGLSALAAVASIDGNMLHFIRQEIPEEAPAYFLIDVPQRSIETLYRDVTAIPGVLRMESEPSLRGRIMAIAGTPAEKAQVSEDTAWALRNERGLTYKTAKPQGYKIVAGEWWPEDYNGPPVICLTADLARGFGIGVGDTLGVNVMGRTITATIACLREVEWTTLALNHAIVFGPGVLENAPHAYIATIYTAGPQADGDLLSLMAEHFPEVTAIYVKEVLQDVSRIFDNIGLAVRSTAMMTLLAGLLVLAETLRASLRARHYEAVVFKVLGATRWDIVRTLACEFLLIGGATAILAAALGAIVSLVFVDTVIRGDWRFLPLPLLGVCAGGVLSTLVLGLLGVRGVLGRKAWPVLRNE